MSIKSAISQLRVDHVGPMLEPGRTLEDAELRRLLAIKPSRVLATLAGHRYTLTAKSWIERGGERLSTLEDTVKVHLDLARDWRVDHSTQFLNRGDSATNRYRGCMQVGGKYLVSNGGDAWMSIADRSVDDGSCLDTSTSWLRDILVAAIEGVVAEVEPRTDRKSPWARVKLRGMGSNETREIPLTWTSSGEHANSKAIYGPRPTLLRSHATMQRLVGHLIIHRSSGAIKEADVRLRFAVLKGQPAVVEVAVSMTSIADDSKIKTPPHRSVGVRRRVVRDIDKLLRGERRGVAGTRTSSQQNKPRRPGPGMINRAGSSSDKAVNPRQSGRK